MDSATLVTLIVAVLGTGGLSAIVTSYFNGRKVRAEIEQSNTAYINKKLQEISESYQQQTKELQLDNESLSDKINDLNNRLQILMEWVMYDNQQYRQWLENKIHELDPEITLPPCKPPPNIFGTNVRGSNDKQSKQHH